MAKVALLVGVSEYEPGLNPLPAAVKDLDAVREILIHRDMGGFVEADVTLLKNPVRQVMEEAIYTLFSGRQKDDLVLLFFSGHGIKDDAGRLYLATRGTRKTPQGDLIRPTAVSANFIHESMTNSRSKRQIVILDSCFSGAFAEGLSAKDDGSVDIRTQLGGEGRAVLTSSSSTQYSFEQQGEELSLYTRFLIEGIKSGEADQDEDEFISIDELHEYASQKVRELQPSMKPEIYAIREGFKIRLTKVAPGDPVQRYRKEVSRFIHRGEISFVGRRTLDVLRTRLGLEAIEAKAIEDEVLEPYRIAFREKLQQYEQVFTELLERDETITESDRADLQNLQQILGLRNEDTVPIEAEVTARFKTHQQNLRAYEQAFGAAVWQEYPLRETTRIRLQKTQQQLGLTAAEIKAIESRITAEVEVYHQKLQEYERLFANATQQEYPLSEATRANLRQQQQRLSLKDTEIAPIEAQITTRIETYNQKLQQYEQAFVNATQRKYFPNEITQTQLRQTWQTLGLSEIDVETIESRIAREIETYQKNLQQYEQEFAGATEREYPLSEAKRQALALLRQQYALTEEDVAPIETRITAEIEEHQQKVQQYEQVFREAIQFEYPVSEATREELKRFQQILELEDEEVAEIEARIFERQPNTPNSSTEQEPLQATPVVENVVQPTREEAVRETSPVGDDYQKKLQQYEQEVRRKVEAEASIDSYYIQNQLWQLQNALKIKDVDAKQIQTVVRGIPVVKTKAQQTEQERGKYQQNLEKYEQEVIKKVRSGVNLNDYYIQNQLRQMQRALKLTDVEKKQIEAKVLKQTEVSKSQQNPSQSSETAPPPVQPQYREEAVKPSIRPEAVAKSANPALFVPSQDAATSINSTQTHLNKPKIWSMWVLACTVGGSLGWVMASPIFFGNSSIGSSFLTCTVVGASIGILQWLVLRQLRVRTPWWKWGGATAVGYGFGFATAHFFFSDLYSTGMVLPLVEILYGLVIGISVGIAQWFVLRKITAKTGWWIVAVIFGESVGGAVGWSISSNYSTETTAQFAVRGLIAGGVIGILSGAITGSALLWLLHHPILEPRRNISE